MKKLTVAIVVAATFWFVMFSPWTSPYCNFWIVMAIAAGVLMTLSFAFGKDWRYQFSFNLKDIALGVGSAIILWAIFYVGNDISGKLFDFARPQVNDVYAMKDGQSPLALTLALLFWIGPAEEIFWRGFVQRILRESKMGDMKAFIITTVIYAAVHIWAFNFMLFMAALVCGAFWGFIYMKTRRLSTVMISHAIWDAAVFILFPVTSL
jgi:membrane protease YdiL (CAAX protease family)